MCYLVLRDTFSTQHTYAYHIRIRKKIANETFISMVGVNYRCFKLRRSNNGSDCFLNFCIHIKPHRRTFMIELTIWVLKVFIKTS